MDIIISFINFPRHADISPVLQSYKKGLLKIHDLYVPICIKERAFYL